LMIGKIGCKQIERVCLLGFCLFLTRSYKTPGWDCLCHQAEIEALKIVIQTDLTTFPKTALRSQHNLRLFTRSEVNSLRKLFTPALLLEQDPSDPLITVQVVGTSRLNGFHSSTILIGFSRAPPDGSPESSLA
jgi:hypothetical protein